METRDLINRLESARSTSEFMRISDSYFEGQTPVNQEYNPTPKEALERLKSAEESYAFNYSFCEEDGWLNDDSKYHLGCAEKNLEKESSALLKMVGNGVGINLSQEKVKKLERYSKGDFSELEEGD